MCPHDRLCGGNILSTYTAEGDNTDMQALELKLADYSLYGSSRLGTFAVDDDNVDGGPGSTQDYYEERRFQYGRGYKQYELTNHLGNVLATVSDRKFGVSSGSSSLIDHYEPHIVTAQDYYPFGMLSRVALPNNNKDYKFGFNGKLNDNDVKGGLGNQQDYGMRIYDPRVGRFLSVDPLTKSFAMLTPYQFASNTPIWAVDLDGGEAKLYFEVFLEKNGNVGAVLKSVKDLPKSIDGYTAILSYQGRTFSSKVYDFKTTENLANSAAIDLYSAWVLTPGGKNHWYTDKTTIEGINDENEQNLREIQGGQERFDGAALTTMAFASSLIESTPTNYSSTTRASTNAQVIRATGSTGPVKSDAAASKKLKSYGSYGSETLDIPPMLEQKLEGGAYRARRFGGIWEGASLKDVINKFVPGANSTSSFGKTVYTTAGSNYSVIYDEGGNYFRIANKNNIGRRIYTDLDGNVPNNKIINGRTIGRTQDEYNAATHFSNTDKQ